MSVAATLSDAEFAAELAYRRALYDYQRTPPGGWAITDHRRTIKSTDGVSTEDALAMFRKAIPFPKHLLPPARPNR